MRIILVFLACGALQAQDRATQEKAATALNQLRALVDQNTARAQVMSGQLVSGEIVKGAPYAAEAFTETVQTLADGNRIVQKSSSKEYRDSEGRERREETSSMGAIFISDPVAKVNYTLHPDTHKAEKQPFGRVSTPVPQIRLTGKSFYFLNGDQSQAVVFNPGGKDSLEKKESLGTRQIEGVMANGVRSVSTIPAGSAGNDRPIDIVDETWYSPDLQLTVMTSHNDPRSGETTYKLTNIQRIEQVPSLFEVPSDYKINAQPQTFHFTVDRTF